MGASPPRRFDVVFIDGPMAHYTPVAQQIEAAYDEGILIVAPTGDVGDPFDANGFPKPMPFPANHPDVISVGGTTSFDAWTGTSFIGPELVAPATGILSAGVPNSNGGCTNGTYANCSGTRSGAPIVAAAAAMVKGALPYLTNQQVRERLRSTAVDRGDLGHDEFYGYGRVDVANAVGYTPSAFIIDIEGPVCLYDAGSYQFRAVVTSGGESPFTYSWLTQRYPWTSWDSQGSGQIKSIYFPAGSYGTTIRVTARDSGGQKSMGQKSIRTISVYMDTSSGGMSFGAAPGDAETNATQCSQQPPPV